MVADLASWQYYNIMPKPDITPEDHRLGTYWLPGIQAVVIRVEYCGEATDLSVIPNFDMTGGRNGGSLVNEDPAADLKQGF